MEKILIYLFGKHYQGALFLMAIFVMIIILVLTFDLTGIINLTN